jgi:hypothetical protein
VPENPSRKDAEQALHSLRHFFRTFAFADAGMTYDDDLHGDVVADPHFQMDESTFLCGLMTGVCRQSMETAPGFLTSAPIFSGAGTGKGLLVKSVSIIATGSRPQAFTSGHDELELDKRLSSALIEARPCIFLDNFNAKDLKSDILASALTEGTMMVRVFGKTKNVPLFTRAFIAITGNGVQIAEDMARRLLLCNLDAKMENPEQHQFKGGFLDSVYDQRALLLSAVLTIWRYGQQNEVRRGLPLGNYEVWARWVRDPLLELGCHDPVLRIVQIKADDPRRKAITEVFEAWWRQHGDQPVKATGLHDEVKQLLDPNAAMNDGLLKYNRQHVARWLVKHKGTRVGGYWIEEIDDDRYSRNRGTTYRLHSPYEELTTKPASIHTKKERFMGFH